MSVENSIVQPNAQQTINELVNALDALTKAMDQIVAQLNCEMIDDEVSLETVAVISGLRHLLHTSRNACISCSEQLAAEHQVLDKKEETVLRVNPSLTADGHYYL